MRLSAVNFIRKSLSKSFNIGIVYKTVGFKCISSTISRQYTEVFTKFYQSNGIWKINGRLQFQKYPTPTMNQNVTKRKIEFFDNKNSKSSECYYLESGLYLPLTDIVEAMKTLIQERHNHSENGITDKVPRSTQKVLRLTLQMKDLVFYSSVRIWDTIWEVMLVLNLE